MKFVERIVSLCSGAPIAVAALCVALGIGGGLYTSAEFNMDTDSTKLISDQVGWRQRENHFDKLFPQQVNLILVVVDGATPELAEAGTAALTSALDGEKNSSHGFAAPMVEPSSTRTGCSFCPTKMSNRRPSR